MGPAIGGPVNAEPGCRLRKAETEEEEKQVKKTSVRIP